MHYFRPSHRRRTTISLSRKEVCKLGLNVMKRVDESILGGVAGEEAGKEGVEAQMEAVKSRLEMLNQEFDKDSGLRNRSASTSDLLDDPPKGKKAEHRVNQRTRNHTFQGAEDDVVPMKQGSIESPSLEDHLKKCYQPAMMKRQVSDPHTGLRQADIGSDWTFVDPTTDAARVRAGTRNSKLLVEKGAKKVGNKAKKAVEKSLSASGRFTHKLVKTAQALRRGSVSSSKRKQLAMSVVSTSMDELLEEPSPVESSVAGPRKGSSKSEPPSPMPKAGTMPKGGKKGTLPRLSRPKSTKSVGSSNSLSRSRRKSAKSGGFLSASSQPFADSTSAMALTESIYRLSNSAVQPSHGESELGGLLSASWLASVSLQGFAESLQ